MRGLSMFWSKLAWFGVLFAACGGESRSGPDRGGADSVGGDLATGGAAESGGPGATRGGTTSNDSAGAAGDDSGAGAGVPGQGGVAGDAAAPETNTTEVIDDGDHPDENTPLPPNTSGFWWGGTHLGNWFVNAPAPNAYQRDARRAEVTPPRDDSVWAYRVQDTGRERGVDLWAQLDHPMGRAVDLGAYTGFAFWARLSGGTGLLVVGMNPGVSYFEAPGMVPSVELSVSSEWQRFELDFEQFGIDTRAVASLDFIVGEGGGDFDFWLDDLTLRCRTTCDPSD